MAVALGLDWTPDRAAQRRLGAGEAVAEVKPAPDGAGLVRAAIDIAAPAALVWRVMTDCRETPSLIESASPCRVLAADPSGAWDVREQVTKGGLFFPSLRNVYRSDYAPFGLIRFRKAGGDLTEEDGAWRLVPLAGGRVTRVLYVNLVGARTLIPAPLVRLGLERDTAKVLLNLRRECLRAGRP